MDFQFLKYEVREGVARITLNRPEVYNALNDVITYELQDAFKVVAKDELVRVVVLTGEGKAFCSGQDLKPTSARATAGEPASAKATAGEGKRSFLESLQKRYNPIIRGIRNLPKPVVGRLNGVAAGAGCSLALACDIVVASEEATLIEVFVNIGLVPDSGSSFFLPRLTGMAKAFELCSMGSRVKAKEALELGLVNKVVPADQLDVAVKEYTDYFANAPTRAIGLLKKMLNKSANSSLEEMLEYEAYCQEIAGNTLDYQEGVKAFLEKRRPVFLGK
jgi:2-(1,2-epoxy-1,2-dihydrophenyl)acetyl-CoA isomerase